MGDPSAVVEGNLLEESMFDVAWMVLGSVLGELVVGEGPAAFSVYEPRPNDLPYLGEVPIPPAPGGRGPRTPSEVLLCRREAHP